MYNNTYLPNISIVIVQFRAIDYRCDIQQWMDCYFSLFFVIDPRELAARRYPTVQHHRRRRTSD